MRCPSCQTINRDDREECYHCGQDLKMLRLIVNRARQHYNEAAEHLERGRLVEALAELQNALELDAKFEEARILRGVIYLRLERPEDARREWDKALEANPNSSRAHRHLNELAPVSRVLPLVRRVYALLAACAAVVLLSLAAVIAAQRPSELENRLRDGWAAFGARRMADAQEQLRALPRPLPRPDLEESAQLLDDSITAIEQRSLASIERALTQHDFEAASEGLDALEAMIPSSATRIAMLRLRRAIGDLAADAVLPGGDPDSGHLRTAFLNLESMRPWLGAESGRVERQLRELTAARLTELEAKFRGMVGANPDSPELPVMLAELDTLTRVSAIPTPIQELRELLESAVAEERISAARAALESGDVTAFEHAARRAEQVTGAQEEITALRAILADRQRDELVAQLRVALEENNRSAALILARDAAQLGVALPQEWNAQLERLRERRSTEAYYALMDRADEIERGALSLEEARAVLDLVQQARESLPPRLASSAQSHLLFFSAVAHLRAGDEKRAQEEIAVLSGLFVESPYLDRWDDLVAER